MRRVISGMYSAASGMDAATARHELASKNIAFASQPGYRRTISQSDRFRAALDEASESEVESAAANDGSSLEVDFTPGHMEHTGRTLDVALQGEGFFVIEGPTGPLYTRNGRFQLSPTGVLSSVDGLPVSGTSGEIRVQPGTSVDSLQIAADGRVSAGGKQLGQLEIVQFEDPSLLQRTGITLFAAPDGVDTENSTAAVVQGVVEQSNVQPITELVSLVVASRQYEAAQLALKSLHDAVGMNVNR
jgi:flagellar basal-body rod protein FlgF